MLARYIEKDKHNDKSNPSLSKSVLDNPVIVELKVEDVPIEQEVDNIPEAYSEHADPDEKVTVDTYSGKPHGSGIGNPPTKEANTIETMVVTLDAEIAIVPPDALQGTETRGAAEGSYDQLPKKVTHNHSSGQATVAKAHKSGVGQPTPCKIPSVETRRGAAERKLKTVQGIKEDSNPYCLDVILDSVVEATVVPIEALQLLNEQSPKK
jgi:hypothetical protein